jgi:5-(carboxyamino)imidazole ribonucleotide mutase
MSNNPPVVILMSSESDSEILKHAEAMLTEFGIAHESQIFHIDREAKEAVDFISKAEARGVEVLIASAGGAPHLAGITAAHTVLPVLSVPIESPSAKGLDLLFSSVQTPGEIPVGTLAIGTAGAKNAALLAVAILATSRPALRNKLRQFRASQAKKVLADKLP